MQAAIRPAHYAQLFLLALTWSLTFMTMKLTVETIPPATATALRLVIAAAFLYVFIRAQGVTLPAGRRGWPWFLAMGFFGNSLPFVLITGGLAHIDSGVGAILMAAMPLGTAVLAHFFVPGERMTLRRLAAVAIGYSGILLLIGPGALAGLGEAVLAELAVIGGALCYSTATVIARRMPKMSPQQSGTGTAIAACFLSVPFAFAAESPLAIDPSLVSILSTAFLAVVGTALASILYFHLVRHTEAGFVAQINYVIPVLGVIWGALFLSESFAASDLAALALILSGVWMAGRGGQKDRVRRERGAEAE